MGSTEKTAEILVKEYLLKHGITEKSIIVIGFSGGPDSAALMKILREVRGGPLGLVCAYYNHGIRTEEEMASELELVRSLTSSEGICLVEGAAGQGYIEAKAEKEGRSLEDLAREMRYGFFRKVLEDKNAEYLALGHNLDDNAETMIMRFIQGSGPGGLSGIPERRDLIIRPLIQCPKKLILKYLEQKKIDYSVDSTNFESEYFRNKIRHTVCPVIEKTVPGYRKNLYQLSGRIALYNDFIRTEHRKRLVWKTADNGLMIDKSLFFSEHPAVRIESLYEAVGRIVPGGRINAAALKDSAMNSGIESGGILLETAEFTIYCRGRHIFIQRLVKCNKKSYLLYLEKGIFRTACGQVFYASDCSKNQDDGGYICLEDIKPPVLVRSFRKGDSMQINSGMKSLKKLFSEWQVSREDRGIIPVIEDRRGVIAVAGSHLGYRNRLSDLMKAGGGSGGKIMLKINLMDGDSK